MGAEPLAESCKLAFEVARQGVEANPPIDPPASMRSFLYVAQLPRRAMTVAHRVIDTDSEFRERVAAQATEAKVGTAGFLWLHRPDGWESSFSALTGESVEQTPPPPPPAPQAERPAAADVSAPEAAAASIPPPPAPPAPEPVPADVTQPVPVNPLAPVAPSAETPTAEPPVAAQPPTALISEPAAVPQPPAPASERPTQPKAPDLNTGRSEIENELASLRGLVDRLADERQNVGSSVENLETEVVERRAESSALTTQLDSVSSDLQRARNERDAALTEKEEATGRQVVADRELADLRAELSAARIQLTRFETEKGDVVSDLASAQETAAALEIQISQFDTERLALRQQMESVVGERDEAWSAMADLRTERDALADRVRVAEQARIDLEAELGEVSTNWQDLQVELRNLAGQRQAVETELNELQQARQISDNERQTIFTELASTLGRVEAERDLLAGKLDAAQARLHGTRTALDSASASIHGELDGVDAAFGETTKASAGLDEAVRDASQRLSEIEAEVAANPVTDSVPVPSVANLDMPDSTMPDIAIGGIAEADPGQLDDLDPFAGADLPGAEASPELELIPGVVSSESDPLQGVEASATVEDTAPAVDAAVAPDADPDDVVLFGGPVPVDPAIADPVADDLISIDPVVVDPVVVDPVVVDPVVVDPVVVDPVDVDPIAADSIATEAVVEASAGGENPAAEVAAPELTVETPSMEAPSFDAPSMPEPPMVDSSAEGEAGDITPPPAPTQSLDDVMESHGLGAGESPDEAVEPVSERAQISPIAGDTVALARHAVSTPDVVILLDGDPIAEMGWPTLSVVERREALVGYLGNLAAETGAASDVVFEGRVGSESDLPISRAVRVRLTHTTIEAVDAVKEVIDEYPLAWPVVVVSDDPRMAAIAKTAGASMLDNGQLLDLFLANA